jgi:hypothetical protein
MRNCARCNKPIAKGQETVPDPCCAAPDCENTTDISHFECLPRYLQLLEMD